MPENTNGCWTMTLKNNTHKKLEQFLLSSEGENHTLVNILNRYIKAQCALLDPLKHFYLLQLRISEDYRQFQLTQSNCILGISWYPMRICLKIEISKSYVCL